MAWSVFEGKTKDGSPAFMAIDESQAETLRPETLAKYEWKIVQSGLPERGAKSLAQELRKGHNPSEGLNGEYQHRSLKDSLGGG